jgi:hypothetical protein
MNTVRVFGAHTSSCGVITDAWRDITQVIAGHLRKVCGKIDGPALRRKIEGLRRETAPAN